MASGMIRWVGAVVLLCGGLAAALLPPTGEWLIDLGYEPRERLPEEVRERDLSSDVQEATELLARRHWVAVFREALEGRDVGEPLFIPVGEMEGADPEHLEAWRRLVERETRLLPRGADGTGLAVFFLGAWHDLPGGYRHRHRGNAEYYLLDGASGPVCVVAVFQPALALQDSRIERGGQVLGPCAVHATHGLPGPGVHRWLEAGAYLFMDEPSPTRPGEAVARRREIFGIRTFENRLPPLAQRCLAGRMDACREWLLAPDELESGFFRWTGTMDHFVAERSEMISGQRGYTALPEAHLVADLEAEFGSNRFRSFWRSGEPMPEAFARAFGEEPGAWMHRWAVSRYGEEKSGPGFGLLTAVLSLLTLGATFLVSAYVADRRSVG